MSAALEAGAEDVQTADEVFEIYTDPADFQTVEGALTEAGFVFEDAAQAARRFSGEEAGNVYSRFSNPTVSAFEQRLAALEKNVKRFPEQWFNYYEFWGT